MFEFTIQGSIVAGTLDSSTICGHLQLESHKYVGVIYGGEGDIGPLEPPLSKTQYKNRFFYKIVVISSTYSKSVKEIISILKKLLFIMKGEKMTALKARIKCFAILM